MISTKPHLFRWARAILLGTASFLLAPATPSFAAPPKGAELLMKRISAERHCPDHRKATAPPLREIELTMAGITGEKAMLLDAILNDHVEGVLWAKMTSIDSSIQVARWQVKTSGDQNSLKQSFERCLSQVAALGVIKVETRLVRVGLDPIGSLEAFGPSDGRLVIAFRRPPTSPPSPTPTPPTPSTPLPGPPAATGAPPSATVPRRGNAGVSGAPGLPTVVVASEANTAGSDQPADNGSPSSRWVLGLAIGAAGLRRLFRQA